MIKATNKTIHNIVEQEIERHGYNADLNNIDTSDVTNMSYLFINSRFNGDISKWNTSNVTTMSYMFYESSFNGDISQWNTSNVTTMRCMFVDSPFNGDISQWNVDVLDTKSEQCLIKVRDSQRIVNILPKQVRSFVKPTYTWQDYQHDLD